MIGVALAATALVVAGCGGASAGPGASGSSSDGVSPAASAPSSNPSTNPTSDSTSNSTTPHASAPTAGPTTASPGKAVTAARWTRMAAFPLPALDPATGVWDGHELLVAGVVRGAGTGAAAAYNPATNTWRKLPTPPRLARSQDVPQAVWTGREMIVLGAQIAYNPARNTWRVLPDSPDASRGGSFAMVWTGHLVLSFGGGCCGGPDDYAAAYNPATNTWTRLPKSPLGAAWVRGAWTGRELIVIAEPTDEGQPSPNTAAYNPTTHTWRLLAPIPEQRTGATATWDGREILVVGGWTNRSGHYGAATSNLAYNPATNTWRRLSAGDHGRVDHSAVWTGRQLLVWGGGTINSATTFIPAAHGLAFTPATGRWTALPTSPLRGRMDPVIVWTGHVAIVWGGGLTDGAIYIP